MENPYLPPAPERVASRPVTDAGEERRRYLKRERAIRVTAILYQLAGGICLLMAIRMVLERSPDTHEFLAILVAGLVSLNVGIFLYHLHGWARIVCMLLALPLFMTAPTGLMALAQLAVLIPPSAGKICAPEYREIVAVTPQLSKMSYLIAGAFVVLVAWAAILYAWFWLAFVKF